MLITNENLYTTGEFARICGVKKQTLFHYDEIGLFSPAYTDENGYRYYSHQQFDLFMVILALKDLQMTLKDIKFFLDTRTPDSLITLFQNQKRTLDIQIKNMCNISNMMNTKIKLVKKASSINPSSINVEYKEKEFLKLSDSFENKSEKEKLFIISKHIKYRKEHQFHCGHAVGGMVKKDVLLHSNKTDYAYYYTKIDQPKPEDVVYEKPEGYYIVAYHHGHYNTTYKSYQRILSYAKDHNYKLGQYSYEESLIDEVSTNDPNQYLTQILVHVFP